MADQSYEHFKNFSSSGLSFEEKKRVWIEISDLTDADLDAMMARSSERQASVPPVGSPAPDFEIERLTRDRKRTGEYVSLSALKGRPVALCFGSFT